ncbi:hypothetical protein ACWD6R_21020 [Streptomyces sp. NPDC005151]
MLRAEGRLQKLDFWLRNPDYLADELLNDYEREKEAINLELAGGILDSDEPEICAIRMLRYLFGAFEYIDQAMSILAAPRLVLVVPRRTAKRVLQASTGTRHWSCRPRRRARMLPAGPSLSPSSPDSMPTLP